MPPSGGALGATSLLRDVWVKLIIAVVVFIAAASSKWLIRGALPVADAVIAELKAVVDVPIPPPPPPPPDPGVQDPGMQVSHELVKPVNGAVSDILFWVQGCVAGNTEADAVLEMVYLCRCEGKGDCIVLWLVGEPSPIKCDIVEAGHFGGVVLLTSPKGTAIVGTMTIELPSRSLKAGETLKVRIELTDANAGEIVLTLFAAK